MMNRLLSNKSNHLRIICRVLIKKEEQGISSTKEQNRLQATHAKTNKS